MSWHIYIVTKENGPVLWTAPVPREFERRDGTWGNCDYSDPTRAPYDILKAFGIPEDQQHEDTLYAFEACEAYTDEPEDPNDGSNRTLASVLVTGLVLREIRRGPEKTSYAQTMRKELRVAQTTPHNTRETINHLCNAVDYLLELAAREDP